MAKKIREEKKKRAVAGIILPVSLAAAVLAVMAAIFMFYGKISGDTRAIFVQEPVITVNLPAVESFKSPRYFTVFKSILYGTPVYTFVRYEGPGRKNMLIRIDLTVLEPGKTGLEKSESSVTAPGAAVRAKIFLQEKRETETGKNSGQGISYEEDYRLFRPGTQSSFEMNGRQWVKQVLSKIEAVDDGEQRKTWANIYTAHKGRLFVFDFTVVAGFTDKYTKKADDYAQELKQAEDYVLEILKEIKFN